MSILHYVAGLLKAAVPPLVPYATSLLACAKEGCGRDGCFAFGVFPFKPGGNSPLSTFSNRTP
jgi:hypothetical protein